MIVILDAKIPDSERWNITNHESHEKYFLTFEEDDKKICINFKIHFM